MRPGYRLQSLGLVLAGFLLGIIVAGLNRGADGPPSVSPYAGASADYAGASDFQPVATTQVWDVLIDQNSEGRRIALGQNGQVRVVVQDDRSALYVFTYKEGDPLWQGRLMDVGNDGTIEIADLSFGHCEAFN